MRVVTREDRARGVLTGLAIGDALGAPVEFDPPERIAGRRDELFALPGGGGFGWGRGEFTDDTQMTLVLARHLAGGTFDADGLARDFAAWASHTGTADVGIQTRRVLGAVARGEDWRGAVRQLDPEAAGNGSLMRTSPAALAGADLEAVRALARRQSEVTHPHRWCQDACAVFSAAVRLTIDTGTPPALEALAESASEPGIREAILRAVDSRPPAMSGFVLHTLTGALWAVYGAASFEDAVWRAVQLGHDADTVGAVAGALAGARWGRAAIPEDLASKLATRHPLFAPVDANALDGLATALLHG